MNETELPREALYPDETPAPPVPQAPEAPPQPPFRCSWAEFAAALAMYALGWIWFSLNKPAWLCVIVALFVGLTELLHRQTPRPRESWFWLGCMLTLTAAVVFGRYHAWEKPGWPILFLHIFAVWWVLCRGGRLAGGESGRLLPLDALNGFLVFPFKHFFLRIRCVFSKLRRRRDPARKLNVDAILWSGAAVILAVLLFAEAVHLLTAADEGFGTLLEDFVGLFSFEFNWLRLILSLPVGAYLFGLIAGSAREDAAAVRAQGTRLIYWLRSLRQVPAPVFAVLTAAFGLLYLAFFVLQGRYLFGAFTRTLPEGFVVAEYARQGFFELCRVMAVNFALLWLAARLPRQPLRESRLLRVSAAVLLGESLLFAVIAASKLGLYIDCFGFTPLRLQSFWLVTVLAAGCVCSLVTLFSGKKSFRAWMFFGAATLCLLCLY
ncbi:MAG: DUF4173 domain-containing protein [Oscillospiraceae bacterium]|nr:DUF4173 domain-containing protein [Oscillospiraceae bacterium]